MTDVSEVYGSKRVGRRQRDAPWWRDCLAAVNATATDEDENESEAAPAPPPPSLPTSKGAFKNHPALALPSAFFARERLKAGARAVATFKGELVYARDDVLTLRTQKQWKRLLRKVRDDELARPAAAADEPAAAAAPDDDDDEEAALEAAMNAACDAAEGIANPRALYAEDQTEPWAPDPVGPNGELPVNDYGNVEIFDEAHVPRGGTWLQGKDALPAAVEAGAAFAPVVVGFERKRGDKTPRPKIDGVLVPDDAADVVRAIRDAKVDARDAQQRAVRATRARTRWAALTRALLSRAELRSRYGA